MRKGSKFELCVERMLQELFPEMGWRRNKFFDDESFQSITKRRQVDIYSPVTGVLVEADGFQHFGKLYFNEEYEEDFSEKKDAELNAFVLREKLTLVRISYEEYDRRKDTMKPECIQRLKQLIPSIGPGIHTIGRAYDR